tara:strand:+ start:668 stop:2278 length:1611 start_codon:yes stop_codon:yes gene_type:complete
MALPFKDIDYDPTEVDEATGEIDYAGIFNEPFSESSANPTGPQNIPDPGLPDPGLPSPSTPSPSTPEPQTIPAPPPFNQEGVGNILNAERLTSVDLGDAQQVQGQSIGAAAPGQAAQIAGTVGPEAATVGGVAGPEAATVADAGGLTAAQIAAGADPQAAQISAQDQQARQAQQQQIDALSAMAGGELSPVLEQQRERGIQSVLSQVASQRGVPTSALLREGMRGVEEVERGVQEAAAQQQLQALQALGGAAGQMRQQELGLASQQAQLEQQAELAGSAQEQQRALQQAGFEQQVGLTEAQIDQQSAMAEAGFEQQAEMAASAQEQQRSLQQAEFQQRANEMASQLTQQTAAQNAQMQQQMEMQRVNLEQQRLTQEASFMQEAGINNAQMEQARTIADAQVNQELQATENALVSSLTAQGVNLEIAEQRVGLEMESLREELTYRYWAAREGAIVELGKFVMEQGWFWESSGEQLDEELNAVRMLIGQDLPGFARDVIGSDPLGGFGDVSPDVDAQEAVDVITDPGLGADEINPDMF